MKDDKWIISFGELIQQK